MRSIWFLKKLEPPLGFGFLIDQLGNLEVEMSCALLLLNLINAMW